MPSMKSEDAGAPDAALQRQAAAGYEGPPAMPRWRLALVWAVPVLTGAAIALRLQQPASPEAWREVGWICLAAAFALLAAVLAAQRWRDRAALTVARHAQAAQQERLQELELLDAIIKSSTDIIFAKDLQGRYLWRNRAATREEGALSVQRVGRDDAALFSADEAAALRANDARVIAEDRVLSFEEVLTLGPEPTTFLATKGPLHDAQGRVIGLFGISRDITERRRAEAAVAASELRLSLALTAARMGVWEWDVRTDQVVWSPQVWDIVGRERPADGGSTVHQSDFTRNIHPEDAERVRATMRRAMRAGGPYTDRFRTVLPDGSLRWLANMGLAEHDAQGEAVRILGIVQDVTESVRLDAELTQHRSRLEDLVAERTAELSRSNHALAEADRFYRAVADNVPGLLVYWSRELRCEFANAAYLTSHGKTEAQMRGIRAVDLYTPEQFERFEALARAALRGEPQHIEAVIPRADGSSFHAWVHYLPDLKDGLVRGFFLMVHDISAIKQAELRLRELNVELLDARDKADAANRAKSVFLANMSHEIRTPMNAIIGLAHLMQDDAIEPAQRERLGKVSDAARHLLDIINDVLDLSKIESGKLHLEQIDFDLHALLVRTRALVVDRVHEQGLALVMHGDHLPRWVHGDPTRFSQALLNLLSNAVKFTERGSVTLRAALLEQGPQGLHLRFEIQDTGIGIAADKLGGLFTAFEQADSSTTRRYGGSGLGLVITRQLARLMGGDAGVESELGVGSRFWFSVCLQPASPLPAGAAIDLAPAGPVRASGTQHRSATQSARDAVRANHPGARILLAEDNAVNQEVATELLRSAGLEVDLAETGIEAIAMARRARYDLILMDVQMPELNGLQATRAIRALPGAHATPILAMTANAFGEDRLECLASGMNDHVAKPVDPRGLYETLLRWLPEGRA